MNPESDPLQTRLQFSRPPKSLLGKILSLLLGATLLVLAVMFSVVALAIVAVGGVIFAGWFWWKTRALRQALKENQANAQAFNPNPESMQAASSASATIIEGEFVREAAPGVHAPFLPKNHGRP